MDFSMQFSNPQFFYYDFIFENAFPKSKIGNKFGSIPQILYLYKECYLIFTANSSAMPILRYAPLIQLQVT